jgi:hypothetical protein
MFNSLKWGGQEIGPALCLPTYLETVFSLARVVVGGTILLYDVIRAPEAWKSVGVGEPKGADCFCAWSTIGEYSSSSLCHYEVTPIRTAEAYVSPWLDIRTQTRLSDISEQNAVEPPRERRRRLEKCLFFHCLHDMFLIVFLCCVAHVAVCFRYLFI